MEQKNWAVVRRAAGYLRYDAAEELEVLAALYRVLVPYVNFFQPQMKLTEKTRQGAKVRRRYDRPATPYRRALASPFVSDEAKRALTAAFELLNPAALKRDIGNLQAQLLDLAGRPRPAPHPTAIPGHPWHGDHVLPGLSRASSVRQRTRRWRAS